jgi:hypothetical protein
MGMKSGNIHVS